MNQVPPDNRPSHKPPPTNALSKARARARTAGSGGGYHRPPPVETAPSPPRKPDGLTPVFNHAAKPGEGPPPPLVIDPRKKAAAIARQHAILRKKLSKPAPAAAPTPLGNVTRTVNTEKDRLISEALKAHATASKRLAAISKPPAFKAGESNQLRPVFNRASGVRR